MVDEVFFVKFFEGFDEKFNVVFEVVKYVIVVFMVECDEVVFVVECEEKKKLIFVVFVEVENKELMFGLIEELWVKLVVF